MKLILSKKVLVFSFIPVLFLSSVFFASADFNTAMDSILTENRISYGSASYTVLFGTDVIGEDVSFQEAADKMSEMFPDTAMEWDSPVTLGQFSHIVMSAYSMEGGLMYRLFPGPRYAVRELRFKKIIQGKTYSTMHISGERAFRILGRVLEREEGDNE